MTSPEEATQDGVQQALDTAVSTVTKAGRDFTDAAAQFWQFSDAARYLSLAESYRIVTHVLHKLDAAAILASGGAIVVSKQDFDQLVAHSVTLAKLRAGGVDNWEGYDHALGNGND